MRPPDAHRLSELTVGINLSMVSLIAREGIELQKEAFHIDPIRRKGVDLRAKKH